MLTTVGALFAVATVSISVVTAPINAQHAHVAAAAEDCANGIKPIKDKCPHMTAGVKESVDLHNNNSGSSAVQLSLDAYFSAKKNHTPAQPQGPSPGGSDGSSRRDGDSAAASSNSQSGAAAKDPCHYQVDTSGHSPAMKGHTAAQGYAVIPFCPESISLNNQNTTNFAPAAEVFIPFATPGKPAAPPPPPAPTPPNPTDLAQQVISQLPIPTPTLNLGPHPEHAVVHLPLWLWINNPGPLTAAADLLGVHVQASATISTTSWHMGESGADLDNLYRPESVVDCTGAGTPAPPLDELPADPHTWKPDCGYTYRWKSLPERTNGTGSWPIKADVTWTVTWTSNQGVGGTITLQSTGTTALQVLELKTILVDNPNATINPTTPPTR